MPEGGASALELHDQATGEQLVETGLAAEGGHELEVEAGAGHGRGLRGRAGLIGQVAGPQQHGVADGLRQRHVGVERQVEARLSAPQPPSDSSAPASSSTKNGIATRAIVQRAGEPGGRALAEHPPGQLRRPCAVSGSSASSQSRRFRRRSLRSRRIGCARGISSER